MDFTVLQLGTLPLKISARKQNLLQRAAVINLEGFSKMNRLHPLMSIIIRSDSYKASQFLQSPPDTNFISSYIEARGGHDESVFFGIQAYIKQYLMDPITKEDVDYAEEFILSHGEPFNREGWDIIVNEYAGFLPLLIQAVPEGTVMPTSNVQVQIVNVDYRLPWVTGYVETSMLRGIWYASTVASLSRRIKINIKKAFELTSDTPVEEGINFKLHDFGARGASSGETAMLGGMAHLLNFMGTDTMEGIFGARIYYNESMAGFSIPASEHSTMTSWGTAGEQKAYENMFKQFSGDGKTFAIVSDSYDIFNAVENIFGENMKAEIENSGGTLVVRPDSGDPTIVPIQVIKKLMDKFGYTVNSKGFKVLPSYIRVIQGDGINEESINTIIENMINEQLSIDNIAFGMGGGLLQGVTRDDLKYVMKASCRVDDKGNCFDVFKDPIHGGKTSKKGRLALVADGDSMKTIREDDLNNRENLLQEVYINGRLYVDEDFTTIRARVNY